MGELVIRRRRGGKAHRPRNPQGYAAQTDKTSAEAACRWVLRDVEAVPVERTAPEDRCIRCFPCTKEDA